MRIGTFYLFMAVAPTAPAQSPVLDSLLRVLPGQSGAQRVRTLGEIQWELGFSDPKRAQAFGVEQLRMAEGLKDSALVAQAANDMAITEYRLGRYQKALELNRRALRIRAAARDSVGMAASHSKLGVVFADRLEFDSALVHSFAAGRIYEAMGNLLRSGQVRTSIGHLYDQMGDRSAAERLTREAIAMLQGQGSDYALGMAMAQLCQVLEHQGRFDEAIAAGTGAMPLLERAGATADVANLNNELGKVSTKQGRPADGLPYYRKALQLAEELGDRNGIATYTLNAAKALTDLGKPAEALPLFERSVALSRTEGYHDQRMSALEGWARALELAGDARGALQRHRELLALRDSVYDAQRLQALSDMQVKYETERTERALAEERERGLERENRIARQRLYIVLSAGGALLAALIALLTITRQRARLKAERDAAIIAERERGLKALVESTDAERKRIAQELHDGVGQLLTGLKLRTEALAQARPEWAELATLAGDAGAEVRGIAHRMMPRALGELGLAPAIADMLEKTLRGTGIRTSFEHHGLDQRLPQPVETGVYRIAQELVSNIIRHAQARAVHLQLLRNKGHLVLIVEDDGVGFDARAAKAGLGLQGLHDRARVLHGSLSIVSSRGGGTVATLRVPLTNGQSTGS